MSAVAAEVPAVATACCPHCGAAVEGQADAFCCPGCELAHQIVTEAGLDAYYARRDALPDRPAPVQADWSAVQVEVEDGLAVARLAVDGLRCAACVWVVEGIVERTEGVAEATVSYATGRARVAFDPQRVDLAEVAERIAALGYRPRPVDAAPAADRDLLTRLGVAAFCGANIMLLSASLYAGWFDGMEERYAAMFRWTALALATPVALWSAVPFYRGAWHGLRQGVLHMDLPISLAVVALYGSGVGATLLGEDGYLDSLGMLVALLLAGRVVEARGRRSAADAASALAAGLPALARRVTADGVETVAVDALAPGDRVEVGAGEEVPADGVVDRGAARVRLALLTGEAEPVAIGPGDPVVAGAPLLDGAVTVRVDRVGEATLGRRMAAQVARAADRPLRPTPADRVAPAFTAATLAVATLTFVGWWWTGGLADALRATVAVLVVACPCALGLSWPAAAGAGLGALARRGLVLRSGDALLDLAEVDAVALDKTGTVTGGVPVVVDADDRVLRIAAGLERASTHPVAQAILAEARHRGIALPTADEVREEPGVGPSGRVHGRPYRLRAGGPGEVVLHGEDGVVGAIRLRDVQRSDAPAIVARLTERLPVTLLTGDHPEVAGQVAGAVGLRSVQARMRPEDKVAWIEARQAEGRRVLFVGDGLNDGPALAAADVGLAMGTGATSSVLAADGVIARDGLGPVLAALRVGEQVRRAVRGNLIRSVTYNVVAVGAAAAGFVDPLVAAVLMPLSSGLVLWGASRVEPRVAAQEGQTTQETPCPSSSS